MIKIIASPANVLIVAVVAIALVGCQSAPKTKVADMTATIKYETPKTATKRHDGPKGVASIYIDPEKWATDKISTYQVEGQYLLPHRSGEFGAYLFEKETRRILEKIPPEGVCRDVFEKPTGNMGQMIMINGKRALLIQCSGMFKEKGGEVDSGHPSTGLMLFATTDKGSAMVMAGVEAKLFPKYYKDIIDLMSGVVFQ